MNIHHGDCLDVMAGMDPESVDAIVTDPPYGIGFMGKAWDGAAITARVAEWREDWANNPDVAKRAAKVGRKMLNPVGSPAASAGTYDQSLAGHKAFEVWSRAWAEAAYRVAKPSAYLLAFGGTRTVHRMTCAIEDAGWIIRDMLVWAYASGFPKSKASLKPAWEPIVMARKPGPLRMLAVDACRIPSEGHLQWAEPRDMGYDRGTDNGPVAAEVNPAGRWPANVLLTDPIFDGGWEGVVGGTQSGIWLASTSRSDPPVRNADRRAPSTVTTTTTNGPWTCEHSARDATTASTPASTGGYSRFFLLSKADRADREPVLGGLPANVRAYRRNVHPTVKPVDLMRHLVRLVTPTRGTVLDPFLGSGTTGLAAEMEGFEWIGIEKEAEYVAIAEARLNGTQRGLGLGA